MNRKILLCSAVLISLSSCKKEAEKETHGINLEYMDQSVKPGDDFFRFVNGKWYDQTEIPEDRTRWGSFNELRKKTDQDALSILEEAAGDKSLDTKSDPAKAVALYETYLDTITRNELGISPLIPYLEKIDAIKSTKDVADFINTFSKEGSFGIYSLYVYADKKNSTENAVYLGTGALGLPDRDFYLLQTPDMKEKREKYVSHVARMFGFLGEDENQSNTDADRVLKIETEMALPLLDRVERRDSRLTYNPMSIEELQKLSPVIDWNAYVNSFGLKGVKTIIVSQPKYLKSLEGILAKNKIEDVKAYLKWTLINKSSDLLTTEIEKANWDFYSKTLNGALEQQPIKERALSVINGNIGETLGQLYVDKKFPAEAKIKAKAMISNVLKAFGERIKNVEWMEEETKKGALEKLNKTTVKIGYPDKWEDFSELEIKGLADKGNYFDNIRNISIWQRSKNTADYGKPVDKTRWSMAPQIVNAYFNPVYNEIVFPAGILQPPFYDHKADEAVNYGGIGATIGHEISHSFDDSGARYDAEGNLKNWWTNADLERFTKLGDALADQYSALEPLPGVFVDGKFTLGENIGDLGGVNVAYDALQIHLKEKGNPGLIDNFTPNQRFFISWGTIWRTKDRDEAIKNQVKTDPHAPGKYRAYVPLQNIDAFYEAFDLKEGDKLYISPEKRVKIW